MGEFDTSFYCCSSLLCQENEEACLSEKDREYDESIKLNYYKSSFVSENEGAEYFEKLVQRETDVGFKTNACFSPCPSTSKTWLECARLDAIQWIFKTRASFGFQIHTAYLSITYFDRFISKRSIDDGKLWAIRLLSVACLSVAAKMEECRVPALSEFPIEDYQFENKMIQRMELLVLSTLEWKMGSITPFAYLHYFISKFYGESRPKGLVSKALELIVVMIKEIIFLNLRPSLIAAAAVLAASDGRLTRKAMEIKIDFISLWGSLEKEIKMRKSKTPESVISSHYSSVHYRSVHDPGNSSAISTEAGTKRKLAFNESDQNSQAKKICRP
ncbi:hypothetical protein DITRI_Ditri16bG0044600 [Diplodiscus trichospermus]